MTLRVLENYSAFLSYLPIEAAKTAFKKTINKVHQYGKIAFPYLFYGIKYAAFTYSLYYFPILTGYGFLGGRFAPKYTKPVVQTAWEAWSGMNIETVIMLFLNSLLFHVAVPVHVLLLGVSVGNDLHSWHNKRKFTQEFPPEIPSRTRKKRASTLSSSGVR